MKYFDQYNHLYSVMNKEEEELIKLCTKIEIRKGRQLNILNIKQNDSNICVFFIHGLGGRIGQFRYQIKEFSNKYEIVAYDWYGYGNSDKDYENDSSYSIEEHLKDLDEIYNKFKKEKNIIIGHSMGSAFTMFQSLKQKDISHIILLGSSSELPPSTSSMIWYFPVFLLSMMRSLMSKGFIKMAYHSKTNPELIEYETEASKNNEIFITKSVIVGMKWPTKEQIKSIEIPCLNIIGETDGVMSIEKSKELTTLFKNCQEQVIKDSSHNLMVEKPSEINEIILKFIS